jgi:hypothetical protein
MDIYIFTPFYAAGVADAESDVFAAGGASVISFVTFPIAIVCPYTCD